MSKLKHIAFIVDGNRRWAKKRHIPSLFGHKQGFDLLMDLTYIMHNYGIEYATYYVFSTENWGRSSEEIAYLMNMFREIFDEHKKRMIESEVRFVAIGNRSMLPDDVCEKIAILEDETKHFTKFTVTFAISYGGRDEIVRAAKQIAYDAVNCKLDIDSVDENCFATYLDSDSPYPDAIVRTSEKRLSNFLLWQLAYSEIFFIDKLWPDFTESDLKQIIDEFAQRKMRHGK